MTTINKKKIEEFIRVDHAGERGAVKIYEGQLLALNTLVKDEALKKIIEEMKIHEIKHKNYFAISFDLNDFKNIKNILDDIIFNHKKIDAIISSAGYGVFENLENLKEKEVIDFFNVNLLAHILISKTLVSHFKKKKTGHFIFIGSEASLKGNQKSTLYSAAKHGLLGFVKSFREECNKSEIRVTIINPGMVNSSFFKRFFLLTNYVPIFFTLYK